MHKDYEVIKTAIIEAEKAAIAASTNEDGGTCNFDTAMINFKGWRQPDIDKLAKDAGVEIGDKQTSGYFKNYRFLWFTMNGQGNNRTRCAQAANKSLTAAGIDATMYYQMD